MVGVIEGVCEESDVPYFSCRGITSQSEMWGAGQRLLQRIRSGQRAGDQDPSGVEMSRDIRERPTFISLRLERDPGGYLEVDRIALNTDQLRRDYPPPNPLNQTIRGITPTPASNREGSWELDALDPDVLIGLINEHVRRYLDASLWESQRARPESERLKLTGQNWLAVAKYVSRKHRNGLDMPHVVKRSRHRWRSGLGTSWSRRRSVFPLTGSSTNCWSLAWTTSSANT
jgi:hypothetical protein